MTDETAIDLSEQLAAELAANDEDMSRDEIEAAQTAPRIVDTKAMPARFSNLLAVGRSPAHGRASFGDRDFDTLATRLGTGTHALLLGKPWVIYPGRRVKGKPKKSAPGVPNPSAWDKFREKHADKVIMSPGEYRKAKAMADAIHAHPIAARLLFSPGIVFEETIYWEQTVGTGITRTRRSTPDARGAYHLVELKTARNVEKRAFCRDAGYRAYHGQLADYSSAIEALVGAKPREVYIVAVESSWPHVVQIYQATDRVLDAGRKLVREWLDKLVLAETIGLWPGYSDQIEPLEVWEDVQHDADDDEEADPWKETA